MRLPGDSFRLDYLVGAGLFEQGKVEVRVEQVGIQSER